jgi:hypothetical protein
VAAPFPGFISPALATKIGKVPSGDRWIHERKAALKKMIAKTAIQFSESCCPGCGTAATQQIEPTIG